MLQGNHKLFNTLIHAGEIILQLFKCTLCLY